MNAPTLTLDELRDIIVRVTLPAGSVLGATLQHFYTGDGDTCTTCGRARQLSRDSGERAPFCVDVVTTPAVTVVTLTISAMLLAALARRAARNESKRAHSGVASAIAVTPEIAQLKTQLVATLEHVATSQIGENE